MTINDKIKQILIDKNLTPSYFADEIGVQRSSISHILSGRNRPSFDIIQKIIRRFPELGYEWIMEEDTQGNKQPTAPNYPNRNNLRLTGSGNDRIGNDPVQSVNMYTPPSAGFRSQRHEIPPVFVPTPVSPESTASADVLPAIDRKVVERILIFYTDGSFREYMPTPV